MVETEATGPAPSGEIPYLEKLGLEYPPFAREPDPSFFYRDAELGQRLDMLAHLARYGDLLLMVIAERGGGKTSLLNQFVEENRNELRIGRVEADEDLDADSLAGRIGAAFGMEALGSELELVRALRQAAHGGVPLLAVDDAHRLGADALRLILELADSEEPEGRLLRIVLFCEPAIEQTLDDPGLAPLRERITHTLELPRFTPRQVAGYLHHRLRVAGFDGEESPFPAKVVRRIHRTARGNPSRINDLAHKTLLAKAGRGQAPRLRLAVDRRTVYIAGGAVGAVLVIGALLPIWNGGEETERRETTVALEIPSQLPEQEEVQEAGSATEAVSRPRLRGWPERGGDGEETTVAPEPLPEPPRIGTVEPDEVVGSLDPVELTVSGSGFDEGAEVVVGYTGQRETLAPDAVTVVDEETLRIRVAVGVEPDTWTVRVANPDGTGSDSRSFRVIADPEVAAERGAAPEPEPEPTPEPAPEAAPEPTATGGTVIHNSDWVRERTSGRQTLQLAASRREAVVQELVEGQDWPDEVAVVITSDGWYILVHGDYGDTTAADEAAALLEEEHGQSPWRRSWRDIQARLPGVAVPDAETESFTAAQRDAIAWVAERADGAGTLQLFATRNRERAEALAAEHGDIDPRVVPIRRDGELWFHIIAGDYPDPGAAREALADYPAAVRALEPWARSFQGLKAALPPLD